MEHTVTTVSSENKSRIFYFDILRAFACLCVILLHAASWYAFKDVGSANQWTGNILNSLARVAVPLFVMISGALMLDENYQFSSKKLVGHVAKMIIVFIFWSITYAIAFDVVYPLIMQSSLSINTILESILSGHYHLWFFFMITGLYLILPLLRLWVKKANKKYVEYFLILSMVFAFLIPSILKFGSTFNTTFATLLSIFDKTYLQYIGGFTAYFIAGWYIHNFGFRFSKTVYVCGFVSILISIFGTYLMLNQGSAEGFDGYLTLHVFVQSFAVFLFVKNTFGNVDSNERRIPHRVICCISKYSLGIYVIHAAALTLIRMALLKALPFDVAILNIVIEFVLVLFVSYLLSFVLSKIPLLKHIV